MSNKNTFDIIVVGGGHAGVEAAYMSSQFNLSIALITMPGVGIGSAPCNPSVGGVGKGQVVREIDALGGAMGFLADQAGIQYRTLNESKGFAVQSTRVQIDKEKYSEEAEKFILAISNITILREKVISTEKVDEIFRVATVNSEYYSKKIIFTVGTFLNGKMHTGSEQTDGGRIGCDKSGSVTDLFKNIKTNTYRFKTGTPPRLHKDSIDYSKLEIQPSDPSVQSFHWKNPSNFRNIEQVSCYLAHTNTQTMEIIRENKEKSPMFNGQIKGTGARYCPSIEDKAYRYPEKQVHHVFIEPEGLESDTVYPSGISSSLPRDVQEKYVRSIHGLENAQIEVFGYAVEYDVVDTTQLNITLEHKDLSGLYFAGQVNGTSGYEEAAGQGLVAGINAALSISGKKPFILSRHDSYIGVMIEDLTSNLRDEPYRLFTARSENRLYLREDNTFERMRSYRTSLGLNAEIDKYHYDFELRVQVLSDFCDENMIPESHELLKEFSGELELQKLTRRISVSDLLRQAWVNPVKALERVLFYSNVHFDYAVIQSVAIKKKYDGYIKKAEDQNLKLKKLDSQKINWEEISESKNVSFECRQRIKRIKPQTFGQLKLIEGIRPATLAVVASRAL